MERPPDKPGVYFLVEADGELRYIGKATSLRSRLGDHVRAGRITASTTVHWEILPNEAEAVARESDLIVFLKPLGNRAHVAQEPDVFITLPPCEGAVRHVPTPRERGPHNRRQADEARLRGAAADRRGWRDRPSRAPRPPVRPQRSDPRRRPTSPRSDQGARPRTRSGPGARLLPSRPAKASSTAVATSPSDGTGDRGGSPAVPDG